MKKKDIETVDQIFTTAISNGIFHLSASASVGTNIQIENENVKNFGSCSYLNLEYENELIEGASRYLAEFGTQFSSSRAYVSCKPYLELEDKLSHIMGGSYVIVCQSTSTAHQSALPILVDQDDLVILDHQVHSSVHIASKLLKSSHINTVMIRHNRLDRLEDLIKENFDKYSKIWYLTDGIFSMYGDFCPISELRTLLDKYEKLNLYIDDAHGFAWIGQNGCGHVLNGYDIHPRIFIATSMAKGMGSTGGILAFPSYESKRIVRTCGSLLMFSGPLSPMTLGVSLAACDILLDANRLQSYQDNLMSNIDYTIAKSSELSLPLINPSCSPIFFIATSSPHLATVICQKLLGRNIYVNIAPYPAVPLKNCGIRFTINRLHTFGDIDMLLYAMKDCYNEALHECEIHFSDVLSAFSLKTPDYEHFLFEEEKKSYNNDFKLVIHKSILEFSESEWDKTYFNKTPLFSYRLLHGIESYYSSLNNSEKWLFYYIAIYDKNGTLCFISLFTQSLIKVDMFSKKEVSKEIELVRVTSPDFMVSKILMLGTPFSEGQHYFIMREKIQLDIAWRMIIDEVNRIAIKEKSEIILLRDFTVINEEGKKLFEKYGFLVKSLPDTYSINIGSTKSEYEFLLSLSKNRRKKIKKYVFDAAYLSIKYDNSVSCELVDEIYNLYLSVKNRSYEINTFDLSRKFFDILNEISSSEYTLCYNINGSLIGFIYSFTHNDIYTPLLVGLNYEENEKYNVYRKLLYHTIMRAVSLGYSYVNLGYTAGIEKERFGAKPQKSMGLLSTTDNFNLDYLSIV